MASLMTTPPSGTYPELTPLAKAIRSGVTSQWSTANHSPQRPNPAITSSTIITMPCSSHKPAHAGEVAVRGHEDAVRADHRLEQDGGDRVPALDHDHVGEMPEGALALLGVVGGMERRAVGVRTPELHHAGHARFARPATGVAGHRDRTAGGAVVAAVGGEHLLSPGVPARHAQGVLGGLRPAVGEEHLVQRPRRQFGDQPGRLATSVVGEDRGDRAQLVGLLLDRRHELGVLVADVHVDELAGEVEIGASGLVPEPCPRRAGDDDRVERGLRRPRVEHVGAVVPVRRRAVAGRRVDGRGRGAVVVSRALMRADGIRYRRWRTERAL